MEEKPTSGKDPKPIGEAGGSGFVEGLKIESTDLDKKPTGEVSKDELLYQQVRVEEPPPIPEISTSERGDVCEETNPATEWSQAMTKIKEQEKQKPSRVRALLGSLKKYLPKRLVQKSYFCGIEIRPVRTAIYAFFLTSLFYVFCNSVFLYWMNSIFEEEDQGWSEFRAAGDAAAMNADFSEFAVREQEANQAGVNVSVLEEDLFSGMVAPAKGDFPVSAQVVEMYRVIDNDDNAPIRRSEQLRGLLVSNTRWYERWKPLTTAVSRPPSGIEIVNRLGADESGDGQSGWETRLGTLASKEEIKKYMADMIAQLNASMTTPRRWLIRLGGSWVQWTIFFTAFFTLVLVWRRWWLVDGQAAIIQKWDSRQNLAKGLEIGEGDWANLPAGWSSTRASKARAVKQLDSRGNPLPGIVKASIVHQLDGKPESELEDKIETRVGQVKEDLEKKCYTLLMYLLGALPSLGFIGTLLGIGAALTRTNSLFEADDPASRQQSINDITYQLGIAFDTTLIALVASLFVGLIIQWLKGREFRMLEEFSTKISSNIVPELYRKT